MQLENRRGGWDKAFDWVCQSLGGLAESAYLNVTRRGVNSKGGDLTIRNARVWTGERLRPWAEGLTIRNGRIAALDADDPAGEEIDAKGRLVVPGMSDDHCHPQVPFTLLSPEAPMLQKCASVAEIQGVLRRYLTDYPNDPYPRLFGFMSGMFEAGAEPTRHDLDLVADSKPCYLVSESGHQFWANTRALEEAGVLKANPEIMPDNAVIYRDPDTGLATGYMEETECGGSDGLMIRSVRRLEPLGAARCQVALRMILEMYSSVGVTHIWQKDGYPGTSDLYRKLLELDSLPVRCFLDNLYSPFSTPDDFDAWASHAADLEASGLPPGFLRTDGVKLMYDLPYTTHQAWLFDPYSDGSGGCGGSVFPLDALREQARAADARGLAINFLGIGDRAVHEALNTVEWLREIHPSRNALRRPCVEHSEYVTDSDVRRFAGLDVIPVFNPIGSYPDRTLQDQMTKIMGEERQVRSYHRWKDLFAADARVVAASDFPLAPQDPLIGMHLMVNGSGLDGEPPGGLWPQKNVTVDQALRAYTTNPAYARQEERQIGMLLPGYLGDCAILADDILAEDFDVSRLAWTKTCATVMNGHVMHRDFTDEPKTIDFGQ